MKYSRAQPLAPPTQPIALQRSKKSSKLSASRQLLARSPSWLRNKTGSSPIAFFLMAKKSPPSKSVLEDVPSDRPVAQTAKTPYQCSACESAGFEYTFLRHGSTSELRAGNNASDHRHRPSCACFQDAAARQSVPASTRRGGIPACPTNILRNELGIGRARRRSTSATPVSAAGGPMQMGGELPSSLCTASPNRSQFLTKRSNLKAIHLDLSTAPGPPARQPFSPAMVGRQRRQLSRSCDC
jgi:hypothetical protein